MNYFMVSYTTIKIPDPLLETVEQVIKDHPQLGYRNRSEFIVEAIREKIMRTRDFVKGER